MSELPEALGLASLLAGTLEYAILVRHREEQRHRALDLFAAEETGHEALVRMRLLEEARRPRSWTGLGTRFR